jgi:hypothetical protein
MDFPSFLLLAINVLVSSFPAVNAIGSNDNHSRREQDLQPNATD